MIDPSEALPEHLLLEVDDGVAKLVFNRPEALNPFSEAHLKQLKAAIHAVERRKDVGVVVLTGAGRAFSAGGDLRTLTKEVVIHSGSAMLDAIMAIRRCPKPVLARINGDAVGGGNEIVIACDLAVAASSARLGQAGTRLGWAPIAGATNFLALSIGDKRSREITFLSKVVPASTACEWGWVNEVVPDEELDEAVKRWTDRLLSCSPHGLRLAKTTANLWWDLAYASMASGLSMMDAGLTDEIVAEGVSAFFEKRSPVWDDAPSAQQGTQAEPHPFDK